MIQELTQEQKNEIREHVRKMASKVPLSLLRKTSDLGAVIRTMSDMPPIAPMSTPVPNSSSEQIPKKDMEEDVCKFLSEGLNKGDFDSNSYSITYKWFGRNSKLELLAQFNSSHERSTIWINGDGYSYTPMYSNICQIKEIFLALDEWVENGMQEVMDAKRFKKSKKEELKKLNQISAEVILREALDKTGYTYGLKFLDAYAVVYVRMSNTKKPKTIILNVMYRKIEEEIPVLLDAIGQLMGLYRKFGKHFFICSTLQSSEEIKWFNDGESGAEDETLSQEASLAGGAEDGDDDPDFWICDDGDDESGKKASQDGSTEAEMVDKGDDFWDSDDLPI